MNALPTKKKIVIDIFIFKMIIRKYVTWSVSHIVFMFGYVYVWYVHSEKAEPSSP